MKNFMLVLTLLFTFGAAAIFAKHAADSGNAVPECNGCPYENSAVEEEHISYENCPYGEEYARRRAAEEAVKRNMNELRRLNKEGGSTEEAVNAAEDNIEAAVEEGLSSANTGADYGLNSPHSHSEDTDEHNKTSSAADDSTDSIDEGF